MGVVVVFGGFVCAVHGVVGVGEREGEAAVQQGRDSRRGEGEVGGEKERSGGRGGERSTGVVGGNGGAAVGGACLGRGRRGRWPPARSPEGSSFSKYKIVYGSTRAIATRA